MSFANFGAVVWLFGLFTQSYLSMKAGISTGSAVVLSAVWVVVNLCVCLHSPPPQPVAVSTLLNLV